MIPKADINTFTNMEPWDPRVTDKRDDFPSLASPSSPPSQQGIGGTFADSALLNPPLITNFFHQNNDSTDNKNGINVDNIFASMTEDEAEAPNGNMIYYNTTKSNIFHNFASINNDNRSALTRQESHRYDQRAISSSSSTVTPSIPIRKYSDYTNYYSSRDKAVIPVMTTTHVNNYYGGSIAKTGDCADNGGRISICRSESNDVLSKSMGNTLSRLASKTMTEGESDPTPTIRHAGYLLKRSNMPHVVREDEYTLGDIAQIAPLPDLSDLNIEEKECGRPFFNGLFPLVGGVESNGVSTMSSSERALDNSASSTVKLDTTFRDPIPTTSVTRISSDECITANDEETCFCSQFANYLKQIFDNNRPRDALITSDRTNCRTINLRARSKSQPPISSPVPNQYKMPLKSPAPARSIPVPISPVGQQRATIIPRPRSFSTTLPFVNTGTVEGANTHLRKEYPPPPPDYIDPKDGHIWRSKYCILEEGILYFYRTAEEGESDEARQERYEHRLYSEELEDIVLGEELVSPQRSVAGSKRWSMLSTEDRKSSHDIYDLSKSPMPQRKSDLFGFHNSPFHRQGSSVLIGPIIDAAGDDRGGSRSVMKHTSSISTFQNDDEILWEKRVALNCVGAVRSSEQEHGIHAFELLAYGCGGPDNDTASTFQGEGQNDDVIDRLILRASSSDDRNAWMFQFHRSLTSFVMQQFVTKSTSVAHGNRLWGMRPDSPNNRGGQHRLRLPSGGAVGKGGSIVSPFVAKSSFATSPSGNNSFGGTSFSPHVVGSLSHGHGRNALYRRKVRDGKNAGGDASVVSPLQTPAGTPRGGSSPVELMPSMIMIQSDSSKKQHKVELSSLKGLRDREKIKDGRKSPAATAFASVAPQKYVPPHMRSTASSSASAAPQKYVPPHMRKKLSVSSVDDDAFVVSKKLEENQLSSMDDATKQTKMSKAASIAPVISSESFDGSDTPLSASSMLSEQLDDSENFASASIRLGGCADPRVIVGSILDHHYINRKASVVGNARLDAYGGTGGGYFRRIFKNQTTMDDASSDEDEIWEAMQRSAEPLPTGGGYFNEDEIWEAIQRSAEPLPIRAGEWQGDNGESYHHGESSPTANTYPSSPPPTRAGTGPTTNIMATAAAAGLAATAAAVGGVALCEREGAVRDPKTVYGLHADDVMKMELKRFRSERQPHDPSVKIHHCRTEDETNLLDDLGMIMLNTKSAALKWEVGASSECGVRNSNEDSFVAINNLDNLMKSQGLVSFSEQDLGQTKQQGMYAIFDGHVGNQAARFAAEKFPDILMEQQSVLASRDSACLSSIEEKADLVLRDAFDRLDREFCNLCTLDGRDWDCGSTALVALILDDVVSLANLGDCRGVVCRLVSEGITDAEMDGWEALDQQDNAEDLWDRSNGGGNACDSCSGKLIWKEMTSTHSPLFDEERDRIEKANGWIIQETEIPIGQLHRMDIFDKDVVEIVKRCFADRMKQHRSDPVRQIQIARTCGDLAVSRAIGDRDFKAAYNRPLSDAALGRSWEGPLVFIYPEGHSGRFKGDIVSSIPDIQSFRVDREPTILIMACDGLWDVMDGDDAVRIVKDLLLNKKLSAKDGAARLTELAQHLGSSDNVTVILIRFYWEE